MSDDDKDGKLLPFKKKAQPPEKPESNDPLVKFWRAHAKAPDEAAEKQVIEALDLETLRSLLQRIAHENILMTFRLQLLERVHYFLDVALDGSSDEVVDALEDMDSLGVVDDSDEGA